MFNINTPKLIRTPIRRLGLSKRHSLNSPLGSIRNSSPFQIPTKRPAAVEECNDSNIVSTPTKVPRTEIPDVDSPAMRAIDNNKSNYNEVPMIGTSGADSCTNILTGGKEGDSVNLPRAEHFDEEPSRNSMTDNKEGNCDELLQLIEVWQNGCKEALGSLKTLLNTQYVDKPMTNKQLAQQLGIWEVLKEQFQNDSEMLGSDSEESDALEFEV